MNPRMPADLTAYRACRLCPRRCGVDRTAGGRGVCGETAVCRVAHAGPHFGEEPSFSGTRGSGTIFFSGCSSRCFFCQNRQISAENVGRERSPEELLVLAEELLAKGVHNLNFVTPDHFWPHVSALCRELRGRGVTAPFLCNCSGYQLPELVPAVAEMMDVFLPDFKFADSALAGYCMGAEDYPAVALAALRAMVSAKGFLYPWDVSGERTAERGVLVRHLVLPGQVENSLAVLELLHREFGPDLPLSVMSQYRPMPACAGKGAFARGVNAEEYARVCDRVGELGFWRVYVQELTPETAFLPDFRDAEPFAGNRRPE